MEKVGKEDNKNKAKKKYCNNNLLNLDNQYFLQQ